MVAAELQGSGVARLTMRRRGTEEKKRKEPSRPIYKANGQVACAGIEEPKKWICDRAVASIFGGSLIKVRYIWFFK